MSRKSEFSIAARNKMVINALFHMIFEHLQIIQLHRQHLDSNYISNKYKYVFFLSERDVNFKYVKKNVNVHKFIAIFQLNMYV